jgi:hypothetical protein
MSATASNESEEERGNEHLLCFTGGLIGGGDVEDTIGIDVEGDLDLRNSSGCWWNTGKFELSE